MSVSEITPELYISDAQYAIDTDNIRDIYDSVVGVCRHQQNLPDTCPIIQYHYGLWDSDDCDRGLFTNAVDRVCTEIESDRTLLVHCIAGQSRSPAVVGTALADVHDMHFDYARQQIADERPQININPALREYALDYLDQGTRYI